MRRVLVIGGLTARLQEAIAAAGLVQQCVEVIVAAGLVQKFAEAIVADWEVGRESPKALDIHGGYLNGQMDNNTRRYMEIKPRIPKNSKAYKRPYKYHK